MSRLTTALKLANWNIRTENEKLFPLARRG